MTDYMKQKEGQNIHNSQPYSLEFCHYSDAVKNNSRHFQESVLDVMMFIALATISKGYDPSVSQSVSQSVSPVFLVNATPLKPTNRIS